MLSPSTDLTNRDHRRSRVPRDMLGIPPAVARGVQRVGQTTDERIMVTIRGAMLAPRGGYTRPLLLATGSTNMVCASTPARGVKRLVWRENGAFTVRAAGGSIRNRVGGNTWLGARRNECVASCRMKSTSRYGDGEQREENNATDGTEHTTTASNEASVTENSPPQAAPL